MSTDQDKVNPAPKKVDQAEELKTEGPISEKDEVKAAERKTAKLHKKASASKRNK